MRRRGASIRSPTRMASGRRAPGVWFEPSLPGGINGRGKRGWSRSRNSWMISCGRSVRAHTVSICLRTRKREVPCVNTSLRSSAGIHRERRRRLYARIERASLRTTTGAYHVATMARYGGSWIAASGRTRLSPCSIGALSASITLGAPKPSLASGAPRSVLRSRTASFPSAERLTRYPYSFLHLMR
jgi:hypothetical protein